MGTSTEPSAGSTPTKRLKIIGVHHGTWTDGRTGIIIKTCRGAKTELSR